MRKLPYLFAAILAVPASAEAQELTRGSQRLEMAAEAPVACVISQPTVNSQSNASFSSTGATSGQVSITQLVDAQTAQPRASTIELSLPIVCNASHQVRVTSSNGGLRRAGATGGPGGFQEYLAYQIGIDWSGQTLAFNTANNNATLDASRPAKGSLTIRIATPAGGAPLVAGQYSDSIVLEVQPTN